jgi:hypothetical protein
MSLATAIRQNTDALGQAQTSYKESVLLVDTFVSSVLSSKLPVLKNPPPDLAEYTLAYTNAKTGALRWFNDVACRLHSTPHSVRVYNDTMVAQLDDAKYQAQTLVDNPSDQVARALFTHDLDGLTRQMRLIGVFIDAVIKELGTFEDALPALASQLETIAVKSAHDAHLDQTRISQLAADIQTYEARIKTLTTTLIALGVVDGVALTIGVVTTIALWPIGAVVWLVMGPIVAVTTTYIILDAEEIKADKAKIDADLATIAGLEADVAVLQLLSKSYAAMVSQVEVVKTSLTQMLAAWTQLEGDVSAEVNELQKTMLDANSSLFQGVLDDIDDATNTWNVFYNAAGTLEIDAKVNNAELKVGMTSSEVQSALAGGREMDIIDYFNEVGAQQGTGVPASV